MRPNNQGSALLTALFIMTLVAIVATAMTTRLQGDIYRTRLIINHDKLYMASQAVMFWALSELNNPEQKFTKTDKQGMISQYPDKTAYKGVKITGGLYDLQGKLNLNNLVNIKNIDQYIFLFDQILPKKTDREKMNLALSLKDWISAYDMARGNDSYLAYYRSQKPPYFPSHQLMKSRSEFRLLRDVDAQIDQAIQPYVTVLPQATPININTATIPILKSLGNGLKEAQLEELLKARGTKGFKKTTKLIPILQKLNIPGEQVTIESEFFLSKAYVTNEDLELTVYVLLKRYKDKKGNSTVSVLRESMNDI